MRIISVFSQWNIDKEHVVDNSLYLYLELASVSHLPSLAMVATTALRASDEWEKGGLYLEPHEN
jgi:hypothetical protein